MKTYSLHYLRSILVKSNLFIALPFFEIEVGGKTYMEATIYSVEKTLCFKKGNYTGEWCVHGKNVDEIADQMLACMTDPFASLMLGEQGEYTQQLLWNPEKETFETKKLHQIFHGPAYPIAT